MSASSSAELPLIAPPQAGFETLLVHQAHAERAIRSAFEFERRADRLRGERPEDGPWLGYKIENGVALVPLMGTLISRGAFVGSAWGVTSYEGFRAEMRRAANDPAVSRIALMVDSPGGYVAGVDAAAAAIVSARQKKPVTAVVEGMAASAAYWLASQADEIVASPVSELGSIGVVQAHIDISKLYEDYGIKVTLLYAGAKKVDGNPYGPLPDRVKAEMEARLEDLRMKFAEAVASGRPSMDSAAVLATEASTYLADEAVARGLADRVGTLDETLSKLMTFSAARSGRGYFAEQTMTDKTAQPGGEQGVSKEAHDRAVSAARAEGEAEGVKKGAAAERARISAILDHDNAKGRDSLARHFAFSTVMAPEDAQAALAAAPLAAAEETGLLKEMAGLKQPALGADAGGSGAQMSDYDKGAAEAKKLLGHR